ncbi:MAG: rhomboid family intramembrane serine protease [Pseudomonadota bacterium]|nr:rhomboid family intramembrane serine protease [Pseudomonadota bacterium]
MFQFPPLPPVTSAHRQVAFAFAFAFIAIELACQASDLGLAWPGLRWDLYRQFAFLDPWWERLMAGERAPVQVWWSLLSYSFLHGGLTHLALNCAAFLGLSLVVLRIFGTRLYLLFYLVTAVGGAVTYGWLADAEGPMVGVSGVVFGFLGVLKYAEFAFITRRRGEGSMRKFASSLFALLMVNVVISVALSGMLAWQTHLGGFVAGWVAAWAVVPKA